MLLIHTQVQNRFAQPVRHAAERSDSNGTAVFLAHFGERSAHGEDRFTGQVPGDKMFAGSNQMVYIDKPRLKPPGPSHNVL